MSTLETKRTASRATMAKVIESVDMKINAAAQQAAKKSVSAYGFSTRSDLAFAHAVTWLMPVLQAGDTKELKAFSVIFRHHYLNGVNKRNKELGRPTVTENAATKQMSRLKKAAEKAIELGLEKAEEIAVQIGTQTDADKTAKAKPVSDSQSHASTGPISQEEVVASAGRTVGVEPTDESVAVSSGLRMAKLVIGMAETLETMPKLTAGERRDVEALIKEAQRLLNAIG